ncbi:hypothetical protein PQG02_26315 [Nostoc sp. UHCC 0926]|uniref:hypothetical protein n=1 Tax=unclassified Nostoc TaxID=2593658 RepID=UPI002360FB70|nr:hypothetical protein [Nostoc sp. UHCC 0926]WDD32148.1 hypothetical protein PQG02_26315 [Nostoc sp. UHCC 0926]
MAKPLQELAVPVVSASGSDEGASPPTALLKTGDALAFGHPTAGASLSLWEKTALAWLHKQSPPLRTKEKLSV